MKKTISILITITMLFSLALILTPNVSAVAKTCYIRGYVYVDGVITTPEEVKILISNKEIKATIPGDPEGYYILDFTGEIGDTGVFHVTTPAGTWQANETITIKQNQDLYKINLTINTSQPPINNCPEINNPNPPDKATNQATSTTLSVNVNDNDGDTLTVNFYNAADNSLIGTDTISGGSGTASVNWNGLTNDETYNWYVTVYDGICTVTSASDTWSFTTEESTGGTGGNTGGGNGGGNTGGGGGDNTGNTGGNSGGTTNNPPTAVITGPDIGNPEEPLEFNALDSSDSDGTIDLYEWDLDNDGEYDDANGVTVTHSWSLPPNELSAIYTISLKVTDNKGATDTTSKTITITKGNNPPLKPTINGPTTGYINTEYNFTAVTTDADNDTIQYIFYWGDGTKTITDFLPNGTETPEQKHTWSTAGTYTISVNTYDNETYSGNTTMTITIEEPVQETTPPASKEKTTGDNTILWYAGGIIIIIILLVILAFLVTRKKEKKP